MNKPNNAFQIVPNIVWIVKNNYVINVFQDTICKMEYVCLNVQTTQSNKAKIVWILKIYQMPSM